MLDFLRPILITLKQKWTLLMVYKTLLTLNPSFVLKSLIFPGRTHPKPCRRDQEEDPHLATPTMPPVPPPPALPRIITYYQTHHTPDGVPISVLPLLTQPGIRLTHLILAAIHINGDPDGLTLNDHAPSHPRFQTLWAELRVLQASGVKVLGMLGGAAKGSFSRERLDAPDGDPAFERYYAPLRDLVRERGLDGIDLDVEEEMSLAGAVRLVDRLRADFGPGFIITFAPVAAALLDSRRNLSGFDYEALEVMRGRDIAWYNCQFCKCSIS